MILSCVTDEYARANNISLSPDTREDTALRDLTDGAGPDNVILVGIVTKDSSADEVSLSLEELSRLVDTAGGTVYAKLVQNKQTPDARTVIGSGKVSELAGLCEAGDASLAVFDCDLSPIQIRNLEDDIEKELKKNGPRNHADRSVRVIDRSMLILDIFALHAVTAEGKLQVELAQLQYTAPRLTGHGTEMSRLGGGIGTRGPGESKLESDRRHMKRRIDALKAELALMEKNRRTMRASRDKSGIPKLAIVGYTNAGKSTLLNTLTGAGVKAEDKLFATLDPTTRKAVLPSGEAILLTDTVGFVRKLPHHLIDAFKSTLEEAVYADVLLILLDASDPECVEQLKVTEQLMADLGADAKPTLYVFNKCDKPSPDEATVREAMAYCRRAAADRHEGDRDRVIAVSALTGQGCDTLLAAISNVIQNGKHRVRLSIPNSRGGILSRLYGDRASIEHIDYGADSITVDAIVDDTLYGQLAGYRIDPIPSPDTAEEDD